METWIKIIKQYGVTGLLTLWLWITHNKVERLEEKLYDCLDNRKYLQKIGDRTVIPNQSDAIIPKDYLSEEIKKLRG